MLVKVRIYAIWAFLLTPNNPGYSVFEDKDIHSDIIHFQENSFPCPSTIAVLPKWLSWVRSSSKRILGVWMVSEKRCERPVNVLPPSSVLIHFWTCNKTRLRQPAWLVQAHR